MKKIIHTITIVVLAVSTSLAQELKLEEAINIALTNNHNIVSAKQQELANEQTIHRGAVGYLPKIDASGSLSYSDNISDQEFGGNSFPDIKGAEAVSGSASAKVTASYMIFNGFARSRSYAKLKEGGKLSVLQTKISIEGTLLQVVNSYYDVVRKTEQKDLIEQSISISKDRLKRVETNYEFGNGSKINVLNARVDFNNDSSSYINADLALRQAKHQLNYLLGRSIETVFTVSKEMEVPIAETLNVYKEKAKNNNTSVILTEVQLSMAEIDKKLSKSNFMPTISSQINYGYSGTANEVGVIQKSTSIGYTASVSLSWNLFDGFKRKKALEQAKILLDMNGTKRAQAVLNVEMELQNYY